MKNSKNTKPAVQIVEMPNGLKLQITTTKKWVKADSNGDAIKDQNGKYLEPTSFLLAQQLWNDYTSAFVDTHAFKSLNDKEQEKAKRWIKATQERGTSFNLIEVDDVQTEILQG